MLVVCDLDGVIWLGDEPIPGGDQAIAQLRERGHQILFLTNAGTRTIAALQEKLTQAGISTQRDEILTSAQIAAQYIRDNLGDVGVYRFAGDGVAEALADASLSEVPWSEADAVVVSLHTTFTYETLDATILAVRAGAAFIATNSDPTNPLPDGLHLGTGGLVAAVQIASGVEPIIVGKPHKQTVDAVRSRASNGIVIGDRPSTDGVLARELGWRFAYVEGDVGNSETAGDSWISGPNLQKVVERLPE